MKPIETNIRIRYGETDQMGVVYHGNYAQYLEIGRIEWLRALGISYKSMEESGVMLPVISLSLVYRKPAYYDDEIKVITKLKKKPSIKIEFSYEIYNQNGDLLTTAETTLAFINMQTNKPMRCPEYIIEKLE